MEKLAILLGGILFFAGCASTESTRTVSTYPPEIESTIPAVGAPAISVYGTGTGGSTTRNGDPSARRSNTAGTVGAPSADNYNNTTIYNSSSTTGLGASTPPATVRQSGSIRSSAAGTSGSTIGTQGSASSSGYPGSSLNRKSNSGSPATSTSGVNSSQPNAGLLTGTLSQDSTNPRSTTNTVNGINPGSSSPTSSGTPGTTRNVGTGNNSDNTSTNSLSNGNTPGSSSPGQ